jgi:hypothetical protein
MSVSVSSVFVSCVEEALWLGWSSIQEVLPIVHKIHSSRWILIGNTDGQTLFNMRSTQLRIHLETHYFGTFLVLLSSWKISEIFKEKHITTLCVVFEDRVTLKILSSTVTSHTSATFRKSVLLSSSVSKGKAGKQYLDRL